MHSHGVDTVSVTSENLAFHEASKKGLAGLSLVRLETAKATDPLDGVLTDHGVNVLQRASLVFATAQEKKCRGFHWLGRRSGCRTAGNE
jgi:hypothetical protein